MSWVFIKLCENTKKYKHAYPGSNKFVYGACEQESEEKIQHFDFWKCKKLANAIFFIIMLLCISKEAARWVDFRIESQIKNFSKIIELQLHM